MTLEYEFTNPDANFSEAVPVAPSFGIALTLEACADSPPPAPGEIQIHYLASVSSGLAFNPTVGSDNQLLRLTGTFTPGGDGIVFVPGTADFVSGNYTWTSVYNGPPSGDSFVVGLYTVPGYDTTIWALRVFAGTTYTFSEDFDYETSSPQGAFGGDWHSHTPTDPIYVANATPSSEGDLNTAIEATTVSSFNFYSTESSSMSIPGPAAASNRFFVPFAGTGCYGGTPTVSAPTLVKIDNESPVITDPFTWLKSIVTGSVGPLDMTWDSCTGFETTFEGANWEGGHVSLEIKGI